MPSTAFEQILAASVKAGISDIHIKVGAPIMVRDGGEIVPVTAEAMNSEAIENIVNRLLEGSPYFAGQSNTKDKFIGITDLDTSFSLTEVGRFRVNIYRQRGSLAVTLRVIPSEIPRLDTLGLPDVLKEIASEARGLVLVTGATGSGKSTTLAAMLEYVNHTFAKKIITIEDPIEFLIRDKRAFISQREIGGDTISLSTALRAALRQDPDIIMVGEMRDRETIEIALKAAETGHLVLSTVHTSDAEGTISRLVGSFDISEHVAVRIRLAEILRSVISQRLLPRKDSDGRIAALEIMRMTTLIRERIVNADNRGFRDLIEQGGNPYRMQTFDQHIIQLYRDGTISYETALANASSPTNFKRSLQFD